MSFVGSNILAGASGQGGEFTIERSLRFNSGDDSRLDNSMSTAGNRSKYTFSFWVKFASYDYAILSCGTSAGGYFEFKFNGNSQLELHGENITNTQTVAVFRDYSAWYHVMLVIDKANSTASDRAIIYVNGTRQTLTTTDQGNTGNTYWGHSAQPHRIGGRTWGGGNEANYYLAEFYHLDNIAATPSDFGETDDNGVWQPIKYAGTYGTIGFHLDFKNNSSNAALGYDAAGSNNWTVNNLSVAAGAGNDSLRDSPSQIADQTDSGSGGTVVGNYATLNPLANGLTLSNGNLDVAKSAGGWASVGATFGLPSGKWYFEYTATTASDNHMVGVISTATAFPTTTYMGSLSTAWAYQSNGNKVNSDTFTGGQGTANSGGDIIQIAVDIDAGKIWFGINNTYIGSGNPASGSNPAYSNLSGTMTPAISLSGTLNGSFNFGQRSWAHSAPSGYKSLNTANLTDPTIADGSKYFRAITRSGGGTNQSFTTLNPGLVWEKNRTDSGNHYIYDKVRGDNKYLDSQSNARENTGSGAMAFSTNSYVVNSSFDWPSNKAIIDWVWDAGTSTVTNNDGSITSQVRANPSAGFSICTYTGTEGGTFGHGLNAAPEFVIVKRRNLDASWCLWHKDIPNTQYLMLDSNAAVNTANVWGDTSPTSSVVSVSGDSYTGNNNDTYVAYCFSSVEGYSAIGSFEPNGTNDNVFVYTGFRPKFILARFTSAGDWMILDTSRRPNGPTGGTLVANEPNSEDGYYGSGQVGFDFLSNGFKIRHNGSPLGDSGKTVIYYCVAENPFKYSRAY